MTDTRCVWWYLHLTTGQTELYCQNNQERDRSTITCARAGLGQTNSCLVLWNSWLTETSLSKSIVVNWCSTDDRLCSPILHHLAERCQTWTCASITSIAIDIIIITCLYTNRILHPLEITLQSWTLCRHVLISMWKIQYSNSMYEWMNEWKNLCLIYCTGNRKRCSRDSMKSVQWVSMEKFMVEKNLKKDVF